MVRSSTVYYLYLPTAFFFESSNCLYIYCHTDLQRIIQANPSTLLYLYYTTQPLTWLSMALKDNCVRVMQLHVVMQLYAAMYVDCIDKSQGSTCICKYFIKVFYVVMKPLRSHLFLSLQISAEFMRLVSTDLHRSFFDGLDKYVPRLLEMYRVRSSSSSDLRHLLQPLDVQVSII